VQLTDRVHLVASGAQGFGLTHPADCHAYLVDGGSEAAVIDAGAGVDPDQLLTRLGASGVEANRVRHLFVTHAHADHAGGAAAVREALGAAVACSPEVADILRAGDEERASVDVGKAQGAYAPDYVYRATEVDTELADGQRIRVGDLEVETVATPGHSTGHLVFLVRGAGRTDLFTGDTLLFGGRIILQDTWDCDLLAHLRTVRRLGELRFGGLFPGHRTISVSDGERHVRAAIEALDRGAIPPTLL
jgi:glyoxylase-like metal-dependent hydrolase (beta-lactamase superfamily II)